MEFSTVESESKEQSSVDTAFTAAAFLLLFWKSFVCIWMVNLRFVFSVLSRLSSSFSSFSLFQRLDVVFQGFNRETRERERENILWSLCFSFFLFCFFILQIFIVWNVRRCVNIRLSFSAAVVSVSQHWLCNSSKGYSWKNMIRP